MLALWKVEAILQQYMQLIELQELFCRRHQIVLPPLLWRFEYHTLVLFFKVKSNLAPPYLTEVLPPPSSN